MSFKCNDCGKTIKTVADVRDCGRCQSSGRSSSIAGHYSSTDFLTPMMLGLMMGSAFASPSHAAPEPEYAPALPPVSDDSSSYSSPSSDSGSSYSSDSGSSSFDSGSLGGIDTGGF